MQEIWKDVPGFEGYYKISSLGQVKSLDRKVKLAKDKWRISHGKIIKPYKNNHGYIIYNLCKENRVHKLLLHRLLAESFIPNINNYPEIDHIDGNPSNNALCNLRWVTHKENSNTEIRKHRLSISHKGDKNVRWGKFGKDNPCSKKIGCYKNGILIHEYESYSEAQNDGFSRKGIYRNVRGITPKYKGFIWKELR